MTKSNGRWQEVACSKCGASAGTPCVRRTPYQGIPHRQRTSAAGDEGPDGNGHFNYWSHLEQEALAKYRASGRGLGNSTGYSIGYPQLE